MAASGVRRCNFISTAEFHSSSTPYNESQLLFPRLMCSRRGCVRAHIPWLVNVDRIPFLQIILPLRAFEHAAFLPPFSSGQRDKSSLSLSLSLQFLQHASSLFPFLDITIKSRIKWRGKRCFGI